MQALKTWLQGIAIVTLLVGGLAIPVALGINPIRDTSFFHNLADFDLFIQYGFLLIIVGVVLLLVSMLIPTVLKIKTKSSSRS
jgi:hypothetical protein